jgi:hypothetical protein
MGLIKEIYWEKAVCVAFVDILYLLIFTFELEYGRKHRLIANHIATTFSRIAGGYAACCLIGILFLVCPDFSMPVMLFPIIMCAVGNEFLGISTGLFLVTLYAMICEAPSLEVAAYMFLVLLAGGLARTLSDKKNRVYVSLLLGFSGMIVTLVFYYLTYEKPGIRIYVCGFLSGVITGLAAYFLFYALRRETDAELENHFWNLISDDYRQVKHLKRNLPDEYAHAKKVSDIAIQISQVLGLSPGLCAAGGFYYRMSKWYGNGLTDAVIEQAQLLNFPIELVRIIAEYNGEYQKPSTPESAIIHMIDALVTRFEEQGKDDARTGWDREMMIYQTLNDFSSAGLYDESGLSMNRFLRVRGCLVKEKLLK